MLQLHRVCGIMWLHSYTKYKNQGGVYMNVRLTKAQGELVMYIPTAEEFARKCEINMSFDEVNMIGKATKKIMGGGQ